MGDDATSHPTRNESRAEDRHGSHLLQKVEGVIFKVPHGADTLLAVGSSH